MIVGFGVAVLAGVGAVARYLTDRGVQRRVGSVFPTGTLIVNASASFVLGVVAGIADHHGVSPVMVTLLSAGFLGGYSTYSTWVFETLALGGAGALAEATINIAGTFIIGLLCAAAGLGLGLI